MTSSNCPLITLTSDFGLRDPYVAAMKGVIYSVNTALQVIDLTHDIPAQNVFEGALFLAGALPYFPPGTIHVAVIDPGVGADRHPIAVRACGYILLCPDNGLPSLFLREYPLQEARNISNPHFMREKISATFHGRDIFAPTAAHLASGAPMSDLGEELDTIVTLDVPKPRHDQHGKIQGCVIHIDRFGNLVTNIHQTLIGKNIPRVVRTGSHHLNGVHRTYSAVPPGSLLALFGSYGYLEIAINRGNAHNAMLLDEGDTVTIEYEPPPAP